MIEPSELWRDSGARSRNSEVPVRVWCAWNVRVEFIKNTKMSPRLLSLVHYRQLTVEHYPVTGSLIGRVVNVGEG